MFSSQNSQVSSAANYIEDVFSTYLYTANGAATQTITNGIDLAGKGGLLWIKDRTSAFDHYLWDSARGTQKYIKSNTTAAQVDNTPYGYTFNSNGFTDAFGYSSGENIVSWTFRKQPKFFDVVTYTGDGTDGRTVAHSLGSVPGCIIVKSTSDSGTNWATYHRSLGDGKYVRLNTTAAVGTAGLFPTIPTATEFYVGNYYDVNSSGVTYVAYLFAHNAGGFGLTGTDNVISCGSFTTDAGGNATVDLGYEPQFVIYRRSSGTDNWAMLDQLRGFLASNSGSVLNANLANAETVSASTYVTSTGFKYVGYASATIIYIAIRRGPMRVPTSGTSVFVPVAQNAATNAVVSTSFPVDLNISAERSRASFPYTLFIDRLRGSSLSSSTLLASQSTNAESNFGVASGIGFDSNVSVVDNLWSGTYGASDSISYYNLRRAPSFFDEVCGTCDSGGTFSSTHALGVAPELMIFKDRTQADSWHVYAAPLGVTKGLELNNANALINYGSYVAYTATSTTASANGLFVAGDKAVAYLFATCPGVSKVGSYTGNGSTQTISCGFTGGARFVLIKRTDTNGDWYVWDTARGMVAGTDPSLLLNSTAAEVNANSIYTTTGGFQIVSTAAGINASGGTYIYLAIA